MKFSPRIHTSNNNKDFDKIIKKYYIRLLANLAFKSNFVKKITEI